MVTTIRKHAKIRPFLKEHRNAAGLSALQMAGRLGVERESVYRYERNPLNMSLDRLEQWADACGLASSRDLYYLPRRPSVDAIIETLPPDMQDMVMDMASRLAKRAG